MNIAFCSGQNCNHSELYGQRNKLVSGRKVFFGEAVPKPEFCSKCGSPMVYGCPKCTTLRRSMDDKFCTKCGTAYK